jgi:SHS2 domain-containing protein
MINVPEHFRPHIKVDYPPNNTSIFEEWFYNNRPKYHCVKCREYLPIFWTSYWVNHDYGNNPIKKQLLQQFVDSLPRNQKYFTIVQYDDGCLVDFKDLDILIFNMSTEGFPIPLTCMDHPYSFDVKRDLLYSYVGSNTHPVRRELKQYTTKRLEIKEYCELHARSIFSLCPRGYGANSFRIKEALQYGAIPVYISDKFIEPFFVDFDEYGVKINLEQVPMLEQILKSFTPEDIERKRERGKEVFKEFYQYEGLRDKILQNI